MEFPRGARFTLLGRPVTDSYFYRPQVMWWGTSKFGDHDAALRAWRGEQAFGTGD